jgi:hypothetical protein
MCWPERRDEYVVDNMVPTYLWGNFVEHIFFLKY